MTKKLAALLFIAFGLLPAARGAIVEVGHTRYNVYILDGVAYPSDFSVHTITGTYYGDGSHLTGISGGGGGGSSSLAVGTGTASNFTNNVTSPTAVVSFLGSQFHSVANGTTNFISLDLVPVANGGTGATVFTLGSVIFAGSGVLSQDNSNFFWNSTTHRLGVGTASPSDTLDVTGNIVIHHSGLGLDLLRAGYDEYLVGQIGAGLLIKDQTTGKSYFTVNESGGALTLGSGDSVTINGSVTVATMTVTGPIIDGAGSTGTAGQVLTSQGVGTYPHWAAASGGSGGYAVEPATVSFRLDPGMTTSTETAGQIILSTAQGNGKFLVPEFRDTNGHLNISVSTTSQGNTNATGIHLSDAYGFLFEHQNIPLLVMANNETSSAIQLNKSVTIATNHSLTVSGSATVVSSATFVSTVTLNAAIIDGAGSAGTAGQVLTSQGMGTYPHWAAGSGGGGGSSVYPATAAASFPFSATASTFGATSAFYYPGFISRCRLGSTSTATVYLQAGSAVVNGAFLVWASSLNWTGSSGSAPLNASQQIVYVYLYSNSGTPTLEASATLPVANTANNDMQKTGDVTRRYVGYFLEFFDNSTTYKVMPFYQQVDGSGRVVEEYYLADDNFLSGLTAPWSIVSGGTSVGSWTSQSMTNYVPAYATHYFPEVKAIFATAGDDGIVGLSSRDLAGSGLNGTSPTYYVRNAGAKNGTRTFFGQSWHELEENSSPKFYWSTYVFSGAISTDIEIFGAKFFR